MQWKAPILIYKDKQESRGWHPWFAWYPVRVGLRWFWLQRVQRKIFYTQGWKIKRYEELA